LGEPLSFFLLLVQPHSLGSGYSLLLLAAVRASPCCGVSATIPLAAAAHIGPSENLAFLMYNYFTPHLGLWRLTFYPSSQKTLLPNSPPGARGLYNTPELPAFLYYLLPHRTYSCLCLLVTKTAPYQPYFFCLAG
jgi:hypothetical protein